MPSSERKERRKEGSEEARKPLLGRVPKILSAMGGYMDADVRVRHRVETQGLFTWSQEHW